MPRGGGRCCPGAAGRVGGGGVRGGGGGALRSGRVQTARRWLVEALARCEANAIVGPSRLVLSALAAAHAQAGEVAAALSAIDELDQVPPFAFVRPEQELGRGWMLAACGDL